MSNAATHDTLALCAAKGAPWRRTLLACALFAALAAGPAPAQDTASPLPNVETLQALRDGAAGNQQLPESDRTAAAAAYDEASRLAQQALDTQKAIADLEARKSSAPDREKERRAELEQLAARAEPKIGEKATLAEVDPQLTAAEADYKAAQAEYEASLADPEQRAARRREIPGLQEAARQREREAQDALNAAPPAGEAGELSSARRVAAQARLEAARAELRLYDTELAAFEALNAQVSLRQEVAKARLGTLERDLKVLREAASRLRREEAAAAARKAAEDLLAVPDCDPAVREMVVKLAKDNEALANERAGDDGLAKKIEDTANAAQAANERLTALREQWNNVRQRVSAGGFSDTVGVLLRKQRADLPEPRALDAEIREREALAANIELLQGEKRQQRLALGDIEAAVDAAMKETMASLSQYEKDRIGSTVKKLASDQRGLIDALTSDYFRYVSQLEELNRIQRELARVSTEFGDYISENVLWIRGRSPVALHTVRDLREAVAWCLDPVQWTAFPARLLADLRANALLAALQALPVLLLVGLRRSLRQRLQRVGAEARGRRETHFGHTVEALLHTFLIALAWPALLWFLAARVSSLADGTAQYNALAAGLAAAAQFVWPIEGFRALFLTDGLADAHFDWSLARAAKALRRLLAAGVLAGAPLVALTTGLIEHADDAYSRSLGNAAFLGLLGLVALVFVRGAALAARSIREDDPGHWFIGAAYTGKLARWSMPSLQAIFAAMSLWGYYYTAVELAGRTYQSALVLAAAAALSATVRRWLLLARRRIAVEQARRQREAMRAEAEGEKPDAHPEENLDIRKVDAQSQAAVRIVTVLAVLLALLQVWGDMAPAFNILQRVPLWNTVGPVEVQSVAADGSVQRSMQERVQTITLANVVLSLAVLFISVLAVRNLPGLIELALLQRFKIGAGERYATLAVVRYALIGLGVVLAFQAIGVGWGKVQWLIAALGVGLGFGLQEIFANFISGLILLFERPVRVGDTVTIAGTSGTVSQIRIRATTITDFDNKDLIVPNKEFVTGKVLNWSLPSESVRVVIPLRLAFGTDTEKALQILLKTAQNHPKVLRTPEPSATFKGFAEHGLDFEVKCFSPDIPSAGPIRHDLNMAINRELDAAGISLAHPGASAPPAV